MLLTTHNYRLAFVFGQDQNQWLVGSCKKTILKLPSGVSARFQIGVLQDCASGEFIDITHVSQLRFELKKMRLGNHRPLPEDPAYLTATVSVDAPAFTAAEWTDGTHQHGTFDFDASETALETGNYWLVFSAFLTDSSLVSLGWGQIEVVQDGTGPVTTVQPLPPSYYTAADVDALLVATQSGAVVNGLPSGGAAGDFLIKSTANNYETEWKTANRFDLIFENALL